MQLFLRLTAVNFVFLQLVPALHECVVLSVLATCFHVFCLGYMVSCVQCRLHIFPRSLSDVFVGVAFLFPIWITSL